MAFRSLEKLINLHDGYRRVFRVDGREVLLIQEGGSRWLVNRYCPHAGQALDDAAVEGDSIRCPRHGYCFALEDGRPLESPCAALPVYSLIYEGNSIGLDETES